MTIDKAKLKALAEAATQNHGAWRVEFDHNGRHVIGDGSWKILSSWHTPDGKGAQNAEFAAAASPATVLALLAEIDQLAFEPAKHARRLIDQLKAENQALRKDAGNWKAVLRAMEQLKADEQGAAIWSACSRILISLASDLNSARSVVTEDGVTKDGAEIGDWRVTVERLAMAKEASHD
ncbi:ead/Ea22-like family protein [Pseudomonas juntendi]|uniref:ead/Ea22-like family protein n=1 Tax=Pseudomonas juntendi TaxID=2666183 RepID=UPI0034572D72